MVAKASLRSLNVSNPPASVAAAFDALDPNLRAHLLALRTAILGVAADDPRIGPLTETLKWGQPAYLTDATKSGTTIRLGTSKKAPNHAALFVHCQTSLVGQWRDLYSGVLDFEDNRAVLFDLNKSLPGDPLRHCIAMALTYHLNK